MKVARAVRTRGKVGDNVKPLPIRMHKDSIFKRLYFYTVHFCGRCNVFFQLQN
ncbi:hypothetical protein QFZ73_006008 [Peribacillus sp. V2I11]|nr:hypothetical protein [Peribacillus sp. V2I11]